VRIFLSVLASLIALFWVAPVFAATTTNIVSAPTQATMDTSFDIQISIQGEPNTNYNLKGRIGVDSGSLTKGLTNNTLNSAPDDWLSDTDSWSKFPTATTDTNGSWQGSLKVKASTTATVGNNLLIFRVRKVSGSTTTYDSSSKTVSLASPPPTPTPTATPTPSSSSSSSSSSSTFSISNIPTEIDSDKSFSTTINLSLSANTKFYLKGAFKKVDNSNYFGQTKVSGNWVKNSSTYSDQFPITTDSSGNWSGIIDVQIDPFDSGYIGSGDYIFKFGRYSDSGSGPTWSDEQSIKINAVAITKEISETDFADEEIGVINLSKISPSPNSEVLAVIKEPEEKIEKIHSLEKYRKIATETAIPLQTDKLKKSTNGINPFIMLGVLTLLGTASFSVYSYGPFGLKSKLNEIYKLFRH